MPAAKKRVTQIATGKKRRKKRRLKPLSLHPMDFDTAMRVILAVAKKPKPS
jgi:hypothetical protein